MHYTGYPLQTHVAAAKAAIDVISANVALEYGPLGIATNVISPGPIGDTEGMRRLSNTQDEAARRGKRVPLQRYGSVRDITDATVFLFSDAASYINGAVIVVDGGAWRVLATGPDSGIQYPDSVLLEDKARL